VKFAGTMAGRLNTQSKDSKLMESTAGIRRPWAALTQSEPLAGAYFWLLVFYFIYCARPEAWILALTILPIAKITGLFALLALLLSLGSAKRGLLSLPREIYYLLALDVYLMVGGLFSPAWKGGAVALTLDFSKALVAIVVTVLAVTGLARLRRLIFVQTGSVVLISAISIVKGHGQYRLQSVVNGIWGNPNDLAFGIAITLPFCFAFMVATPNIVKKAAWAGAMLIATTALMLTASRQGAITLTVVGLFCLWRFAIRGRRPLIVLAAVVVVVLLFVFAGKPLRQRFTAFTGENITTAGEQSAYGSYEQRRMLAAESLSLMKRYPIFGLGAGNFKNFAGSWQDVHVAYLQIGVEGGIPALILFLMFFWRGFVNLRRVRRRPDLDNETRFFADAVYGSLLAYVVGALFAPEAYQYFPLFAVAYTSVLVFITDERREPARVPETTAARRPWRRLNVNTDTTRSKPQVLAH
jgi:O-antigen ligase